MRRSSGPTCANSLNTPSRRHWLIIAPAPNMNRKVSPPPVDVDNSPKRTRKGKENDEFCSVKASIVLSVPPVFANRLRYGVEEMLDTMIMRCAHTSPRTHFSFLSVPQIRTHAEWCRPRALGPAFPRPCRDAPGRQPLRNLPCRLSRAHLETDTRHETQFVHSSRIPPRPFLPQLLNWGRGGSTTLPSLLTSGNKHY